MTLNRTDSPHRNRWLAAAVLLGLMSVAALAPSAAFAQSPVATAVLYEVNEALRFLKQSGRQQVTDPAEFARRVAHASLLGRDVRPLRENKVFKEGGFIQADAFSNVDLGTGRGPLFGTLTLLADMDPARHSLDTLVVVTDGWVRGEVDLTTATQGFARMAGSWGTAKPLRTGTFQGLFLIPFQLPGDERYFYVDLGFDGPGTLCGLPAGICALEVHEFTLGIPLTKAVVMFFE
jgi:hypothetical protein